MDRAINKRSVLLVAAIASFLTPFMGSSVNIALASIAREFGVDAVSLGWVSTAYTLSAAALFVPFGRLADIVGRRKVFVAGVLTYGVSTILSAVATSGTMLIACRAVEGAGGALIFGTGTAMLTSAYPPQERGRVFGINAATVYVGLSIGPTVGGFLTQHLGWRSIFWVTMPLAFMLAILATWQIKGEWAEARGEAFDLPGSVVYGLALVALVYGLSSLPQARGAWLLGLGTVGLAAFVLWEGRVKSPVLEIRLFRENAVFALSNLAAWANYGATTAVGFLLSLYLQYIKGLEPRKAGAILVVQPIVMAIFSPLAGRLSDRVEPRIVASLGMTLTVIGLVMLTALGQATPELFVVACLLVLGLGFALFSSPNTNAIMSSVDRKRYGLASGMVGTMRLTGQMFSMGATMLVFALHIGRVQIAPENYARFLESARIVFTGSAVLCGCGIFASLARGKVRRERHGEA
ncbi:MAG: MFS transporter [Anaerolineae bacterium]|nr:MFS transporter [Anaerolineae bacterium]